MTTDTNETSSVNTVSRPTENAALRNIGSMVNLYSRVTNTSVPITETDYLLQGYEVSFMLNGMTGVEAVAAVAAKVELPISYITSRLQMLEYAALLMEYA